MGQSKIEYLTFPGIGSAFLKKYFSFRKMTVDGPLIKETKFYLNRKEQTVPRAVNKQPLPGKATPVGRLRCFEKRSTYFFGYSKPVDSSIILTGRTSIFAVLL
jgi:hypothetical protein